MTQINESGRISRAGVGRKPVIGAKTSSRTSNERKKVTRFCTITLSGKTIFGKYCRFSMPSARTMLRQQPSIEVDQKLHGTSPLSTYRA